MKTDLLSFKSGTNEADGGLPPEWKLIFPRDKKAPVARLASHGGIPVIAAEGCCDCVGYLQRETAAEPGRSYKMEATFKAVGGFDPYNSIFFTISTEDRAKNDGIFKYEKNADGWIRGSCVFTVPEGECEKLLIKIFIKYVDSGRALIRSLTLSPCDPPPERWVRVAVMNGMAKEWPTWDKALDYAGSQNADIALLTESFNLTYLPEEARGKAYSFMSEKAAKHGMYVSGTYYLNDASDGRFYNSQLIVGRNGEYVGHYYKNHPYDTEAYDFGICSGSEVPVFETDFGRVGCMICYDSWFTDVAELSSLKGAELLLFPAAGLYRRLMAARSADNGLWVAMTSSGGGYGIWDPGGEEIFANKQDDPTMCSYLAGHFKDTASTKIDDLVDVGVATIDLSKRNSPHNWGGPVFSSPGGRKARRQQRTMLYDEIMDEYVL